MILNVRSFPLESVLHSYIGGLWGEEPGRSEVDVKVMRITELGANGTSDLSTSAIRSLTAKQVASRKLHEGDLVLEKSGGGPKTPVGRVALIGALSQEVICSNFMLLMRPNHGLVLSKYLHHFLTYLHMTGQTIPLQSSSTNIRNISTPDYMQIDVPLPTLEEQRRIVESLDEHLSRLDKALAEIDASSLRAASFRRSLLEQALFGDSSLGITTLGDHIQTRKSKGIPSQEPGAKYLGLEHVEAHGGRVLGFDSASKYRSTSPIVEEGDLLYGRLRPYLNKVVISPERLYVSGEFIVMPRSATLDTPFLKYLLMSPRFLAFTALLDTGDRPRVSWDKIANFEFRLPDLEGQKRIVDEIESSLAVTGSMQKDFENLKRHSQTLRRSLLHAAFSGKLGNG